MNRDDSSDSLFVLLSPIESKLEERHRLKTQQTLHGSPLMRAKHAIRRTFSGSSRHDSERKRGTDETGRFATSGCVCELRVFCVCVLLCIVTQFTAAMHRFFAVKEAQDACIWLKTAGFPQYVQKFEGTCGKIYIIDIVWTFRY